ncbi:hypothetical protein SO802_011402 [Lithocarpus litseifolius]|uniref:LAIKA domain-containing protein n=1 Tax=Lithocarpus litseifolius TaxID=425828 RepID=A0AAW2D3P4_9ROSI
MVKKVPAGKTAQNEGTEDKPKDNSDPSSAAVVEGTSVKTTVKKKIIKRIAKKMVSGLESSDGVLGSKKDADGNEIKAVPAVHETKNTEMQVADAENLVTELRSLSLSLDSLLDYTDKDVQESTFELSLFAELLYEMLQYQMGSRILTFLQKLLVKFVTRRNQSQPDDDKTKVKEEDKSVDHVVEVKMEDETDDEDPEEDEEMEESGMQHDLPIM